MMCNGDPSMSADKFVMHGKELRETINFFKRIGGLHCNLHTKTMKFYDQ